MTLLHVLFELAITSFLTPGAWILIAIAAWVASLAFGIGYIVDGEATDAIWSGLIFLVSSALLAWGYKRLGWERKRETGKVP